MMAGAAGVVVALLARFESPPGRNTLVPRWWPACDARPDRIGRKRP
jgi:hypothetical protein